VVAGDHDPVRVRVIVQVHVLRFLERRLDGVVAGRLVGRVPVGGGRAGGDVQAATLRGELGVVQRLPVLFFVRIDLARPARGGNPTAGDRPGGLLALGSHPGG